MCINCRMAKNRRTVRKRRTNATRGLHLNKLRNKKIAKYKNVKGGWTGGNGHNDQNNDDYRDAWNQENPPMEINIKPGVGAIIFNILFSKCVGIHNAGDSNLNQWAEDKGKEDANKEIPIEEIKKNYFSFHNNLQKSLNIKYRVSNSDDKFIAEMCANNAYWRNFNKKIIDQVWNDIMQNYLTIKKQDRVLPNEFITDIIVLAEKQLQEQQPNGFGRAAATLKDRLTAMPNTTTSNTSTNARKEILSKLNANKMQFMGRAAYKKEVNQALTNAGLNLLTEAEIAELRATPVGGKYKRTRRNKRKGTRRNKRN